MPEAAAAYPGWKRAEGEIVRVFVNADGERIVQHIAEDALAERFYGDVPLVEWVERDMARRGFSPLETPDA